MEIAGWLGTNVFNLLSAIGIIGGLWFTAISFRAEAKSRQVSNLLALTQNHQRIWQDFYHQPDLARVLEATAELKRQPLKRAEEEFVNLVIQHLNCVYQATKNGLLIKPEGLRREISEFFTLPIPKAVWDKIKILQNDDFAAFVESCRNWK
jgi:hypothetical protein